VRRLRDAAIIPLGLESLRGSSSLPEGCSFASFDAKHSGRAGPPLLFGLAPRGVFRAPSVTTRAVGSYPTFSPLPCALTQTDALPVFPEACHRSTSVTGGLFSVALSVAALPECARARSDCAAPWRYQARCPSSTALWEFTTMESGLSSRPPFSRTASQRSPGSPACLIIRDYRAHASRVRLDFRAFRAQSAQGAVPTESCFSSNPRGRAGERTRRGPSCCEPLRAAAAFWPGRSSGRKKSACRK